MSEREAAKWREYDQAAEWCAEHGYAGNVGDPLPDLLGADVCAEIDADPEAFERRVREMAYARAMDALNIPDDPPEADGVNVTWAHLGSGFRRR